MKQLHKSPAMPITQSSEPYSPKSNKHNRSIPRSLNYIIREQRLLFILIGVLIGSVFFIMQPSISFMSASDSSGTTPSNSRSHIMSTTRESLGRRYQDPIYEKQMIDRHSFEQTNSVGRVPVAVGRKRNRVVVTGGAGFVGSHLVDKLIVRGDDVIVIDNFFTGRKENVVHLLRNPRFELIRHDVVEPILLEVDQIYHLACPASPVHYKYNPVKTIKTNVMGTLNMLGLAKRIGARFLITSTSEVYGDPLEHPQKETYWGHVNPIGVRSCYDDGKRTAETLSMDYHRGAGVEVRIARIFNTYGPRMCLDDGRVVSNFVSQAIRKQPMTVYGDGKQTRSFQYVADLVDGLMALMEGEHVGPFNLGNPGEFTMLELAEVVKEVVDPSATIEFKPNTADDPHKRKPDISKAKALLNWEPKVALRDGLPRMVDDFRNRILNEDEGRGN